MKGCVVSSLFELVGIYFENIRNFFFILDCELKNFMVIFFIGEIFNFLFNKMFSNF